MRVEGDGMGSFVAQNLGNAGIIGVEQSVGEWKKFYSLMINIIFYGSHFLSLLFFFSSNHKNNVEIAKQPDCLPAYVYALISHRHHRTQIKWQQFSTFSIKISFRFPVCRSVFHKTVVAAKTTANR